MTGFGAHLVLFHDRDAELVAGVADFLAEGLAAGEGGVVVATAAHADAIGRGLHLIRARSSAWVEPSAPVH